MNMNQWNIITSEKATLLTAKWQEQNTLKAFLFHRNEIACIRAEKDAEKIHFYFGLNKGVVEMIAVGVAGDGEDIIGNDTNSKIYNFAMPCPSTCDMRSPLYHGAVIENNPVTFRVPPENLSCIERLQEISLNTAITWTLAWQKQHPLKSFLYDLNQLAIAMDRTESASIRVYFGLDESNNKLPFSIMVGVNSKGEDDVTKILQINKTTLCSKENEFSSSCNEKSPLYHGV
ncbi:hypothetical protein [uncultured Dokdonia sp.]|uniref:hypothetical protein n=1 Tax=uncultured Dokdonia sp. TaxID=575653 RepID=UPI00262C1291|nr:hypothetical protein [uncultured Dokdonia sp.]